MSNVYYSDKKHFTTKAGESSAVFPIILSPHGARSALIVDGDKIWWEINEMRDWSFLGKSVGPSFTPNFKEASEYIFKNWEKLVALAALGGGSRLTLRQGSIQVDVDKSAGEVAYCPNELKPVCTAIATIKGLPLKKVDEYIIRAYVWGYPFEGEK